VTEKISVDGELVWANPNYNPQPVPEGFDPKGSVKQAVLIKATPAWRIAARLDPFAAWQDDTYVRDITRFDDGRVMADVLINGEWGRYVCTADEIEARKGGQKVDNDLEVMA
jgi:hypothetical protein